MANKKLPAENQTLKNVIYILIQCSWGLPQTLLGFIVHQAAGFIGGIVKQVNADLLGHHPGHRRVLLLGDVAGKGG